MYEKLFQVFWWQGSLNMLTGNKIHAFIFTDIFMYKSQTRKNNFTFCKIGLGCEILYSNLWVLVCSGYAAALIYDEVGWSQDIGSRISCFVMIYFFFSLHSNFEQESCIDICSTKWMNLNQRQMAVFMEVGPLADKKMGHPTGQGMWLNFIWYCFVEWNQNKLQPVHNCFSILFSLLA